MVQLFCAQRPKDEWLWIYVFRFISVIHYQYWWTCFKIFYHIYIWWFVIINQFQTRKGVCLKKKRDFQSNGNFLSKNKVSTKMDHFAVTEALDFVSRNRTNLFRSKNYLFSLELEKKKQRGLKGLKTECQS